MQQNQRSVPHPGNAQPSYPPAGQPQYAGPPVEQYHQKSPQPQVQQKMLTKVTLSMDESLRRFRGRFDYGLAHCISEDEFWNVVHRINVAFKKEYHRRTKLPLGVPLICLVLGVLLIALAIVNAKIGFIIAGVVLIGTGIAAGWIFSVGLTFLFLPVGITLLFLPLVNEDWAYYTCGTIICISGLIGLLAFGFKEHGIALRTMSVLLPVGICLIILPSTTGADDKDSVRQHVAFIVAGVIITIFGIFMLFGYIFQNDLRYKRAVRALRFVLQRLNNEYGDRMQWSLDEAEYDTMKIRSSHQRYRVSALQIVVQASGYNGNQYDGATGPAKGLPVQQQGYAPTAQNQQAAVAYPPTAQNQQAAVAYPPTAQNQQAAGYPPNVLNQQTGVNMNYAY